MPISVDVIQKFAKAYESAWNSVNPAHVAGCYAEHGAIIINRGTPWQGRAKVAEMAAGFYANVNNMRVFLDDLRIAGDHVAFIWTFTGQHAVTGNPLEVKGWEEWDLDSEGRIATSRGWYDADGYALQVAGS